MTGEGAGAGVSAPVDIALGHGVGGRSTGAGRAVDSVDLDGAVGTADLRSSVDTADGGERWMIALDVDGTLITKDDVLFDETHEAVTAARAYGHEVVIATGRSLAATTPIQERLGIERGWAVASNGSVTYRLNPGYLSTDSTFAPGVELTDVITFDPAPAMRLIRDHVPDAIFAVENLGKGFFLTEPFPDGELTGVMEVVDFETLIAIPATRVTIRAPEQSHDDFLEMVDRIGLHGLSYAVGWLAWLDLNPDGVNKASALEVVRTRAGVAANRTVTIGDGRNDVEMLQWAAHGVAMGDAPDGVKAVADAVTGTVEEHGVAQVINRLLETGRP